MRRGGGANVSCFFFFLFLFFSFHFAATVVFVTGDVDGAADGQQTTRCHITSNNNERKSGRRGRRDSSFRIAQRCVDDYYQHLRMPHPQMSQKQQKIDAWSLSLELVDVVECCGSVVE